MMERPPRTSSSVADLHPRLEAALSGRYTIERELGRGGMAIVYLAQDLKHRRRVAIKVLHPELAAAVGPERFLREIETAARLNHPHILPLHDSGEADRFLYYVMPFVDGESLRDRLNRERQLPIEDAVAIADAVASALSYAHSHDVVHRDIKPENILLSHDQAVVTDFGIAGAIAAAAGGKLTQTGIVLGTPAYMSPEQASGERALDGRSDVYSLGCVLYEMLAGEPPFTGLTDQAIIAKRFTDPVPSARRLRETVPPPVDRAISKALARAPVDRFATTHQFAEALRVSAAAVADTIAGQAPATPATPASDDLSEAGRHAFARHAWRQAFETLSKANAARALPVEDVERLAESAWWIGRIDDCIAARERAYAAYMDQENPRLAALVAVRLAEDFFRRQAKSLGNGWLKRAERLLQDVPECREHGALLRLHAVIALETEGNVDKALGLARRTADIATRFHDRDLQALALHDVGRMLVSKGELAPGMAMIDEAMAAAVSGDLGPEVTGRIYCNMMGTCEKLADYQRAAEWSEAARRWCELHTESGFPGICRVHRAELMRLRGSWSGAETEALRAAQELQGFYHIAAGEAFYEIGEIRLRMGDLKRAEEVFRQAHELGRDPVPGLALVRLAEGKIEAAKALIDRAIADRPGESLERARLLPARVQIALAAGDLDLARETVTELEAIAGEYGSTAFQASAAQARGAVELADSCRDGAVPNLRRACKLWQEVQLPYETATARLLLAGAYRATGCSEDAELELQAALSTFRGLGADITTASALSAQTIS
jgi:tetratricopeptide (TPR) repeat protein/tRNA A-37 threonylcarbamoyl transferase component Bud32